MHLNICNPVHMIRQWRSYRMFGSLRNRTITNLRVSKQNAGFGDAETLDGVHFFC